MTANELKQLKYGDKIYDSDTGEEYKFGEIQFLGVLSFDKTGRGVWIPPEKVRLDNE